MAHDDLVGHVLAPLGMVVSAQLRPGTPLPYFLAEAVAHPTAYDHPKDAAKPGGLSLNTCTACNNVFRGLPARVLCHVCARPPELEQ